VPALGTLTGGRLLVGRTRVELDPISCATPGLEPEERGPCSREEDGHAAGVEDRDRIAPVWACSPTADVAPPGTIRLAIERPRTGDASTGSRGAKTAS